MISADFYPTQTTAFTVEYTDTIPNLTYDDPETAAAPYYMGYVNWDDVPSMMHMSKINIVSDVTEAYMEFVDITETENAPWFFTGRYSNSSYSTSGNGMYIVDGTTNKYVMPANAGYYYDFGFFNNLSIQRVASYGDYYLFVSTNIINNATTPPTYYYSQRESLYTEGGSTNISWNYMRQWLNGEVKLYTRDFTFNEIRERFEITPEDLMVGRCEKEFTQTDATLQLFISDYQTPYNARDIQPNNDLANYSCQNATVLLHANIDGESKPYITNTTSWHTGYSDEPYINITNYGTGVNHHRIGYSGTIMGGFNGRIPNTFFNNAEQGRWYFFGNFAVVRYTYETTHMQRVIPLTEIIKYFAPLFTRVLNGSTTSYGFSDLIYYPLFNDDNSPKWEYVTGLQEDIEDQLQEWQYTNITANTFTEADIPEYEPEPGPEPGPGGEPDEGDRGVPIPKFGNVPGQTEFVHYAVMSPFAINELATQLWDQPDSFWQKIVAATSENPMDYFISLRYYPLQFDKGDGKSDMYIGRGGELHFANNYYPIFPVEQFNCGSITIARQYNNFLDYAPYTSISVFLPFAGTFELNPTIVMGRTISLWLSVDVSDGSAIWEVYNETDHQPVLVKQCRMAAEIPLSGLDASQMASNVINASLQTAQHALGSVTTDLNSKAGVAAQALGGNGKGAMSGAISTAFNGPQTILTGLGDAYNIAQASKEIPQYSGGSSGAAACGINHTPYIVYRRPLCTNPSNFAHAVGYLSNKTAAISTLSGFTSCRNVDVSGIDQATDTEKAQIKQILESGFYA